MAKFLRLGDGERWTLPDDTDLEQLHTRLSGAMNDGLATSVDVRAGSGVGELILNGKALAAVLLWEEPAGSGHKPTFTMID